MIGIGRLTDEQRDLAETVRSLLAKYSDVRRALDIGYDETLWRMLCDQIGVAALAIPEAYGGFGASVVESHLVLEELGRVLAPTPMLGSALAAQALLASGDTAACERLLPGIAAGTSIAALCLDDYAIGAQFADVLVVATDSGFAEVDPAAAQVHTVAGMDPTRHYSRIEFDDTAARPIECATTLDHVRRIAWTAVSAEQVGAAAHCLDTTVEYAKSRVQFGRPIGSFQALKHRMADMYVLVVSARSASYAATTALASGADSFADDALVARAHCTDAFEHVAAEMIQLHGGIAVTWEHDAHLYFKRAHADKWAFTPRARVSSSAG